MRGRAAKILTAAAERRLLKVAAASSNPARARVMLLLTIKAGLRACEVSAITWAMVTDPRGGVSRLIELPGTAAKMGSGRRVPLHRDLRAALVALMPRRADRKGPIVCSARGGPMAPKAVVNWFGQIYLEAGLAGCSSHSGRRTFVTRAARAVHRAGGSLRDVQELVGHRSIKTTQGYIEGDADAQRRLIRLL